MKAIKYLMIGALMTGFSANTMAQTDNSAIINNINNIILFFLIYLSPSRQVPSRTLCLATKTWCWRRKSSIT